MAVSGNCRIKSGYASSVVGNTADLEKRDLSDLKLNVLGQEENSTKGARALLNACGAILRDGKGLIPILLLTIN